MLGWRAFGMISAAFFAGAAQAQVQESHLHTPEARVELRLRADNTMVLIPVAVSDKKYHPVMGLERANFRVFDDSVEQRVTAFSMDDEPVAVGLVFDASGSMAPRLGLSRRAAREFFASANPGDEFFLVEFGDKPELRVPLTRDVALIESELLSTRAQGRTALLDAVALAMYQLSRSTLSRKALIILSDGGDNNSRYSASEIRSMVRESDALVYAIGLYGSHDTPEEERGPVLLTRLAEDSGGRMIAVAEDEAPDVAARISWELRNRYVLGYTPSNLQRDGRYHGVQVKVEPPPGFPPLQATWRRGYFAPD